VGEDVEGRLRDAARGSQVYPVEQMCLRESASAAGIYGAAAAAFSQEVKHVEIHSAVFEFGDEVDHAGMPQVRAIFLDELEHDHASAFYIIRELKPMRPMACKMLSVRCALSKA